MFDTELPSGSHVLRAARWGGASLPWPLGAPPTHTPTLHGTQVTPGSGALESLAYARESRRAEVAGEHRNRTDPSPLARRRTGFEDRGEHQLANLSRERPDKKLRRFALAVYPARGAETGAAAKHGSARP